MIEEILKNYETETKRIDKKPERLTFKERRIKKKARITAYYFTLKDEMGLSQSTPDLIAEIIKKAKSQGWEGDVSTAAKALAYACRHNSFAWQAWFANDVPEKQLVRCVVGAHHRHTEATYKELLAAGVEP